MPEYQVYYKKDIRLTVEEAIKNFPENYVPVMRLNEENLEDVYFEMQGEQWSPNGEARRAIKDLGLSHTSIMIGDIVEEIKTGRQFIVDWIGFEVNPKEQNED